MCTFFVVARAKTLMCESRDLYRTTAESCSLLLPFVIRQHAAWWWWWWLMMMIDDDDDDDWWWWWLMMTMMMMMMMIDDDGDWWCWWLMMMMMMMMMMIDDDDELSSLITRETPRQNHHHRAERKGETRAKKKENPLYRIIYMHNKVYSILSLPFLYQVRANILPPAYLAAYTTIACIYLLFASLSFCSPSFSLHARLPTSTSSGLISTTFLGRKWGTEY